MSAFMFYWWRSCGQCKDAKRVLEEMGVELTERDFFKDPFSREELEALCRRVEARELFSWRSPSSKPFRDRRAFIPSNELIDAMLDEPRLIRRPILVPERGDPVVGFTKESYVSLQGELR